MKKQIKKKLISACLVGVKCRYDGKDKVCVKALKLFKKGNIIPVCPEQLGGLSTPRSPAEVIGGSGKNILLKKSRVKDKTGKDVTANFIKGAKEVMKIAEKIGATVFIGKSKSPSCGSRKTFDGTFSDRLVEGDGVTVALLRKNNIDIKTEEEI